MENKKLIHLFAVPLFSKPFKYPEKERFVQHAKSYPTNTLSNVGGFQSINLEQTDEIVSEFIVSAVDCFQEAMSVFGIEENSSILVDNIWLNVNSKDHWNRIHNHPDADFAVVVYFKVPKNSGNICFYSNDPVNQYKSFYTIPLLNDNEFTRLSYCITPQEDTMLIFPGHLMHDVYPNESDEERISVAFNVRIKRRK